jgi:hypothetical protein
VTLAAFPLGTGAMLSLFVGMGTAVSVAASRSGLVDLVLWEELDANVLLAVGAGFTFGTGLALATRLGIRLSDSVVIVCKCQDGRARRCDGCMD